MRRLISNRRHNFAIESWPSIHATTKRNLSSGTQVSFQGMGDAPFAQASSRTVTHVPGLKCYLCIRFGPRLVFHKDGTYTAQDKDGKELWAGTFEIDPTVTPKVWDHRSDDAKKEGKDVLG